MHEENKRVLKNM
jgi:hypothetical protein